MNQKSRLRFCVPFEESKVCREAIKNSRYSISLGNPKAPLLSYNYTILWGVCTLNISYLLNFEEPSTQSIPVGIPFLALLQRRRTRIHLILEPLQLNTGTHCRSLWIIRAWDLGAHVERHHTLARILMSQQTGMLMGAIDIGGGHDDGLLAPVLLIGCGCLISWHGLLCRTWNKEEEEMEEGEAFLWLISQTLVPPDLLNQWKCPSRVWYCNLWPLCSFHNGFEGHHLLMGIRLRPEKIQLTAFRERASPPSRDTLSSSSTETLGSSFTICSTCAHKKWSWWSFS